MSAGIDYRALADHITGALDLLGDAASHEAAVCRDRLTEALMWAMRTRTEDEGEDEEERAG